LELIFSKRENIVPSKIRFNDENNASKTMIFVQNQSNNPLNILNGSTGLYVKLLAFLQSIN
jgi:hypothetical protein